LHALDLDDGVVARSLMTLRLTFLHARAVQQVEILVVALPSIVPSRRSSAPKLGIRGCLDGLREIDSLALGPKACTPDLAALGFAATLCFEEKRSL
jgi:hypothetical protein